MSLTPDDILHWSGGDPTRGTSVPPSALDLSTQYTGYPSYLRLPKVPLAPVDTSQLVLDVVPNDYQSTQVTWSLGADNVDSYNWAALVRSGFGYPNTPNDGQKIFMIRRGDVTGDVILDQPLQSGRWYYYTLFAKIDTRWKILKQDCSVVPIDYHHADHLWNRLPPYYQYLDDQYFAGTSSSVMRRLFSVIGLDLDITRTMAEGLEQVYSVDLGPAHLVNQVGHQNLGIDPYTNLGDVRVRSLSGRATILYQTRGTLSGVGELVGLASQSQTVTRAGRNMLLVPDDSEFVTGIGHWTSMPAHLSYNIPLLATSIKNNSASGSATLSSTKALWSETKLSIADDVDPPIVAVDSFGSLRSMGVNVLKVEPTVNVTEELSGGQWRYKEQVSDLFLCCGAGSFTRRLSDGTSPPMQMDPLAYGIPVVVGKTYHLSFFARKSNFRTTYGYDPVYPLASTRNVSPNTSTAFTEWWNPPEFWWLPSGSLPSPRHDNWVRPVSGTRTTDVLFGVQWYDRDFLKLMPHKGFDDGFGQGITFAPAGHVANDMPSVSSVSDPNRYAFDSYRRVNYSDPAPPTGIPAPGPPDWFDTGISITQTDTWQFFTHSFTAKGDLAVPFIGLLPFATTLNQTNHYLAAISFVQEQDSGVETESDPNRYIVLGPSEVSSVLDSDSLLGPPPLV
jgi:hypothetical protein